MLRAILLITLAGTFVSGGMHFAALADAPRKFQQFESVVNEQSGFMLRVDVDKPGRVYDEGETMTVSITAERDCYVYLLYYDAGDNASCLFPNKHQKDNLIKGKTPERIPVDGSGFSIRTTAPFGEETLHVVAVLQPTDLFTDQPLTKNTATRLSVKEVSKAMEIVENKADRGVWAESRIKITTRKAPPDRPRGEDAGRGRDGDSKPRRLGVFVGISDYKDENVPRLLVSHRDAERMARSLGEKGGLDDVTLLTNDKATKEAIRGAIFEGLVKKSKPGDTVFIYFSGHGGRTPDTNGDESDKFDEYLVPFDGKAGNIESMILDDTFARWVQELDGRKICVVLDNCYSGGASKGMKGIARPVAAGPVKVDFFDGELERAKDLGQADTMVLAASGPDQVAWEMPTGEGSVLTYYLIKSLDEPEADTNKDARLSMAEAFRFAKESIEVYVRKTFQAEQNPLIVDNANDSIYLRP